MNVNKVFILGNLTRDPELRQTPTGQSVCSLGVATNTFFTDRSGQRQKRAEFHTIVVWGRQAEIANQFLKKGSSVFVEGRLQTRSWQDKQGQPRKTTEIIGERIQLGPRPSGMPAASGGAPAMDEAPHDELPEINLEEGSDIKPEEIPF
ncbi:single-stranded DNA-binding protein [Patescibacteria group bacterium]|nr:single-stranded DNA-binding protein [Patescibacteria group bacterium]